MTDIRLHLSGTDFGNFLPSEDGANLTVRAIEESMREKLLLEFKYIRNNAVAPLSTFLDYMTSVYSSSAHPRASESR